MITHATTNLSASELEDYYGNRVRSRMREMFNLIAFDGTAGISENNTNKLSSVSPKSTNKPQQIWQFLALIASTVILYNYFIQ